MDFTRSFYTAAHFALENAESESSIWAVNAKQLDLLFAADADFDIETGHAPTMRSSKAWVASRCIARSFGIKESRPSTEGSQANQVTDRANVIVVEPEQLNQRMVSQQGLFLMPTLPHLGFERNLIGSFALDVESLAEFKACPLEDISTMSRQRSQCLCILRIDLPAQMRFSAMQDLLRMNIHDASLFPGLDGFARSLRSVFLAPAEAD